MQKPSGMNTEGIVAWLAVQVPRLNVGADIESPEDFAGTKRY
jgi:hypothetical protein